MKKLFLILPVMIAGFLITTGQNFNDNSVKWNSDNRMTKLFANGQYTPLPQTDNYIFSTESRTVPTPIGLFVVSPNFRVHPSAGTQSEVPITKHPTNPNIMLGSANTYRGGSTFSTGVYVTTNGGVNWFGSDTLNNGTFSYGDPGPAIDKNGTFLMSYITITGSMGASYSTNLGINWAPTVTFPGASTSADKNLSATDDVPNSPYYGRSYTVYTEFGTTYNNRIVISYTTDGGITWSGITPVSSVPSSGHFHQGADVKVGPNGVVYVVWANNINNGQNSTEDSLGFAKSTDGGVSWAVSRNNASNMNGIRNDGGTFLNGIRTNGFPRIDVDKSGGSRNGWIYVVAGEKSIAPATDVADIILHRSTNGGDNWTSTRVNQDTPGSGKYQYIPAVCIDDTGGVNIVFHDTRNTPTNDSVQMYIARSLDGGNNWSEILVSDHKFKPKPISGLAQGYQGDYIGITTANAKAWPYWCEDITGNYQAWTASVGIVAYPLNAFNLNSPSAGARIVAYPNTQAQYSFSWDTSAISATYKWIFGSPTTTPRKITLNLESNSLVVASYELDSILASIGVAVGDSLVGQWDVWAFRNNQANDSLKAANGARAITLKRGVPPLTAFNLLLPVSGTTITTSAFNPSPINFNWSSSGSGVNYKLKFGSPSISTVRFSLTSNISGIDSSLTIFNYVLDGVLAGAGVNPGDSLVGQWSVWAYNANDSVKASQDFALTLKRQIKGDVMIIYDSTNANCRISRDSIITSLNRLGTTYEQYNRKGVTATNAISFRGFKRVLLLGEGSSVMSSKIKDSLKSYLASGTAQLKSKLIIMSEDVGYYLDRGNSAYYDSAFARSTLGFQYVADRPGVGGRGIRGVTINTNLTDSTYGPSSDVLKRSSSVPASQTFDLYKYRLFPDSVNATGRISGTYNTAIMALDVESIRGAFDSPLSQPPVQRILNGLIKFVDEIPTSNEINEVTNIPYEFSLNQNYPNPFNPKTVIGYQLPTQNFVSLKVYDVTGKEVMTLVNEKQDAGVYKVEFNAINFASGMYFYKIVAGNYVETKRMILLK